MFGTDTQTSNDDPAMLDNVKQLASQPADQVEPAHPAISATIPLPDPAPATTKPEFNASSAHAVPAEGFSSSPLPDPAVDDQDSTDSDDSSIDTSSTDRLFSGFPNTPATSSLTPPPEPVVTTTDDTTTTTDSDTTETPVITSTSLPTDSTPDDTPKPLVDHDQLASMKQEALAHLEPLTEHLDETPEETFKTTMMMIQANDNHTLLEKALGAAKNIEDDKVRAQAMLDIVNEINYFSQNSQNS